MKYIGTLLLIIAFQFIAKAQPFVPVTLTGLEDDVVAESGTSSLTTTTTRLDGASSNRVMYSLAFRTINSIGGGGLADNGLITDAAGTYQLASYAANNATLIPRNINKDITLATPASYRNLRLLAFSTEGTSLVNVTLFFTDGTQTQALTNHSLSDWFDATGNLVIQGFGRCSRTTPVSGADAFPTNPRMYFIDIPVSCINKNKVLQKINVANVTTAGNNAPFPNVVIMALSARANTATVVTASTTNATCTALGSATVNITGSSTPYTVSWNTVPVQTGTTATNLPAGNYIATITDGAGCVTTQNVTVGSTNNLSVSNRTDTTICSGASFVPNFTGNAATYAWTPTGGVSNPTILNPTLSPTATTPYTLTATLGTCTATRNFTVTVTTPTMSTQSNVSICSGSSFTPAFTSNASSFVWTPTNGVSNPAILNPTLSPTNTTPYTVTGTLGNCPISRTFTLTVFQGVTIFAGSDATIFQGDTIRLNASGSAGTYSWTPTTGLNNPAILNPTAKPDTTTTYTLRITSANGCTNTDDVKITVIPFCIKVVNAFSPNGDGINDRWVVTNGNCTSSIDVAVYNRYGNQVYRNTNYTNNWDGTYKGKPLADGTYYYVITYRLLNGTGRMLKGDVTILR
ncbi:MAG: gliding motility-associated C-terminal domain-containing protein [Ferruginibacter sp.]|nr:gliding motility-associated C-terminal domain-containing protein [Ferruginibacter sp.]